MRVRRERGRTRRKSRWEGEFAYRDVSIGTGVPTVAQSSVIDVVWARVPAGAFDNQFGDNVTDDCTLYRMFNLGQFTLIKTLTTGSLSLTLGMGVLAWDGISDTPPNVLEVPTPVQSGGADWLWWWNRSVQLTNLPAGANLEYVNTVGPSELIHSKGMRKLSTNTGLLLVAECYAQISGMGATFSWSHNGRYALKLP